MNPLLEAELLFQRRMMHQQQRVFGASPCQIVTTIPSLLEIEIRLRQESLLAQNVLFPGIFIGEPTRMLPPPLDPAIAVLFQAQQRIGNFATMAMADAELRELLSSRLNVTSEVARAGQQAFAARSRDVIRNDQTNDDEGDHQNNDNSSCNAASDFRSDNDSHSKSDVKDSVELDSYKRTKKEAKWHAMFERLKEYKAQTGDCMVPRGYSLNTRLASWVAEQRKQYRLLKANKPSSITPSRISLLNDLDFAWNAQEAAWDRHINDLRDFKAEHGHCYVPLAHPRYPKLGLWVKEQRRHYSLMKQGKTAHMSPQRAAALDSLGFCWDTHEATWLERMAELAEFKAKFGNCLVPTTYPDNPKLGTWVHHQRRQFKLFQDNKPSHITRERIRALDNLGFVWSPRSRTPPAALQSNVGSAPIVDFNLEDCDLRPRKRRRSSMTD